MGGGACLPRGRGAVARITRFQRGVRILNVQRSPVERGLDGLDGEDGEELTRPTWEFLDISPAYE